MSHKYPLQSPNNSSYHLLKGLPLEGFGDIIVHAGGEEALPVSLHGIGRNCDYRNPVDCGLFFRSKRLSTLFAGIPIPVSFTSKRSVTPASVSSLRSTLMDTSPFSTNLMAFPVRLVRIWRRRPGSASDRNRWSPCRVFQPQSWKSQGCR